VYIERPGRRCPETGEVDPDVIKLMLIGADSPDDLRGLYLDGAVLDEFAQCDPILWGQIVRPALADRKKAAAEVGILLEPWAVFIGTPKGQNHFYHRYEKAKKHELFCKKYEANHDIEQEVEEWMDFEDKNGIVPDLPKVELDRIMENMSETIRYQYGEWRKYVVARSWRTDIYKASETGIIDQTEMDEMISDLSPEEVEQELECSFTAAVLGSYYGHLVNKARADGRIGKFTYNPKYPIDTHWDIGVRDKATIWFSQKINGKVYYLYYYEKSGHGVPHFIKVLDALAGPKGSRVEVDSGEFIGGQGYKYGRHVWPHDGSVQEWGTGVSRQETARQLGLVVEIQPKQRIQDRIQASRTRLEISFFDEENCERGIDCLYNYQKEWDGKKMIFNDKPLHDWSSHGSDSFGYSALDDRPSGFPGQGHRQNQETADNEYDEFAA